MDMIYLDNNATTSTAPEVVEAMSSVLCDEWANPSSIHRMGQMARRRLEHAREQVAGFIVTGRDHLHRWWYGIGEYRNPLMHPRDARPTVRDHQSGRTLRSA